MPLPASTLSKADHRPRKPSPPGKPLLRLIAQRPPSSAPPKAERGTPHDSESMPPPLNTQKGADALPDGLKRTAEVAADKTWSPKRIRTGGSPGDVDEEEDCGSGNDGSRKAENSSTGAFACPFYRRFPLRHMDCLNRKLTRIRDVKQHIKRRHALALYCPTCYVSFPQQSQRDEHIRSRNCQSRPPSAVCGLEGVSDDVQKQLKSRVGRMQSQDEQWYAVWDIVFDKVPRPPKPRLGTVVDETVDMMRDFWSKEGPQIVPEFLESNGLGPERPDKGLESLLMGLFDAVRVRFEQRVRDSISVQALDTTSTNNSQSPLPVDDCLLPLQVATAALPRPESACGGPRREVFDFLHQTEASPTCTWSASSHSMTSAIESWDLTWDEPPGKCDFLDGTIALPFQFNDYDTAGMASQDIFQDLDEFTLDCPPFIAGIGMETAKGAPAGPAERPRKPCLVLGNTTGPPSSSYSLPRQLFPLSILSPFSSYRGLGAEPGLAVN